MVGIPDGSAKFEGMLSSKQQTFFRRLFSTLSLWGFVGAAFYFDRTWLWLVSLLALGLGGLHEFFRLFPRGGFRRFQWHAHLAACLYLFGLWAVPDGFTGSGDFLELEGSVLAFLLIGIVLSRIWSPLEGIRTLQEIMVSVFGFSYVILLLGFVGRILQLPLEENGGNPGFYLLFLLAVTKFTDTGAYAIGSLIGRHKMVPHISPGKTWQGFAGGVGCAFLASFGCLFLVGDKIPLITPFHAAILALLLALIAVLGDLRSRS